MGWFRKKKDEEAPKEPVVTADRVTVIVEGVIREHGGESLPRIAEIIKTELASAKLLSKEGTNA